MTSSALLLMNLSGRRRVIPSVERGIRVGASVRFMKSRRPRGPSLAPRNHTLHVLTQLRAQEDVASLRRTPQSTAPSTARAVCLLVMTLLFAGAPLHAAEASDPACMSLCEERSEAQTQTQCLADELEKAQSELEILLNAAREEWKHQPDDSADPEMRATADAYSKAIPESLDAAQKEWHEYSTADCDAAGAVWTNGSGRRPAVLICRIDRVKRRSLDIWEIYLEPDADLPRPAQLCE